jgi:hypothetical protein
MRNGPQIVTRGLVELLEPTRYDGTTSQTISSDTLGQSFVLTNYSAGTSTGLRTILSNCDATGAGTSYITLARNTALETGSITFTIWFNLKGIPINTGANNNWRGFLCTANSGTAGSPFTMVLEETSINFSTTHTDMYRRYLNNSFAPGTFLSNGWQMLTYTYSQTTGQAAYYNNDTLRRSGPMTSGGSNENPTTAGLALSYTNYQSGGFRIYGGTTTSADPNGNGICPGEVGNIMIYNVDLTAAEVQTNFNALRSRYSV